MQNIIDKTVTPKVAGVYITRQCNLNCGYCTVIKKEVEELDVDQWIKAFSILEKIGIEKIAILGGEPTIKPGIDRIIRYLTEKTKMEVSLISNGTAEPSQLKGLVDAGLKRFSSSVDTLDDNSLDSCTSLKSKKALEHFEKMQAWGAEHITAYFVMSAITMKQVVDVVKNLSKKNVWLYILPYHYATSGEDFWETRDLKKNTDLAIAEDHLPEFQSIMETLVSMKEEGYLISNSESYLLDLPKKIVNFDWHCEEYITELRVDADGSLMCCHDNKGERSSEFTIFDIEDDEKFKEFQNRRKLDAEECPGCLWPSQYHSVEFINKGNAVEGTFIKSQKE